MSTTMEYSHFLIILKYVIANILAVLYFGYATYYFIYTENEHPTVFPNNTDERCHSKCGFQWCNGYGMLLLLYIFTYAGLIYYFILKLKFCGIMHSKWKNIRNTINCKTAGRTSNSVLILIVAGSFGIFLYFDTIGSRNRLISLSAPVIFIFLGYAFSKERNSIKWKTVIIGICCQFILGIFCIRWEVGRQIFQCIGDKLSVFMPYSNQGGEFVFGSELVHKQVFAFATLPVIFFLSFLISILYYLGTMQWIVMKIGWLLQKTLGTTVCESVNSAGNIFLGMSESPLLIKPYIRILTRSEIHAIMVSGFATVSGTVFAAYMSFGANPAHLITSTVMAAPAALAFAKLYYPEIEESLTKSENIELTKSSDSSILDAATNGALTAVPIVLGIVANLVAFIAFVAFLNGIVNWLGYLIGLDYLTFEWIFSKIFIPLSIILGVPQKDWQVVSEVISTKTVINEFAAYQKLGKFQKAGEISDRSFGIATFAICGFANPSSLGIYIGLLSSLAPEKRSQITEVAFRSCIVGSIVCFVSAGFAGFLMTDESLIGMQNNSTKNMI